MASSALQRIREKSAIVDPKKSSVSFLCVPNKWSESIVPNGGPHCMPS